MKAPGYQPSTVSSLSALYVKCMDDINQGLRAAMIPDGGYERARNWDAGEVVKNAAAPEPPIEWTKYPPPRDPFAAKDVKP